MTQWKWQQLSAADDDGDDDDYDDDDNLEKLKRLSHHGQSSHGLAKIWPIR